MLIAYENEGKIITQSFADSAVVVAFPHVVVPLDFPLPVDAWVIENGELKFDQQKYIEFNRQNMPQLTPIEFDIKLHNNGLYDAVQDLIKDNFEMRIAYSRATFFSRTASFVDQARIALGLTDEQVDAMWEQAITL